MDEFTKELKALCGSRGIRPEALEKMRAYYMRMLEYNKLHNLTRIVGPAEAARDHFFDSIVPEGCIPQNAYVADVGSGAGFPIVPLKIVRPDIRATAVESAEKKGRFISEACAALDIAVDVCAVRAEALGRGDMREGFDVCVSRAVARLSMLLELCLPLVRPGGLLIAYKAAYEEELAQAARALELLDAGLEKILPWPDGGAGHNYLVFRKTGATPQKFPRSYAAIRKRPL